MKNSRFVRVATTTGATMLLFSAAACGGSPPGTQGDASLGHQNAVGPQFDTTHVYVQPGTFDAFTASWIATFGGTATPASTVDVTPTPSMTRSQVLLSPVGTLSVFEFTTPIPFPFGSERSGWLMKNLDQGVSAARGSGAHVIVEPFPDPVGRDALIQFPGGVNMQLYWHTTPPAYPPLATVPENRIYVSRDAAEPFLSTYSRFTGGQITSDDPRANGAEIGLPNTTFRRIRMSSPFGDTAIMVNNGHLPFPFGRETTGYRVADLGATLQKATAARATILWGPQRTADRDSAIVQFPGGYVAEIHDVPPR